jgi:hypothetical protein
MPHEGETNGNDSITIQELKIRLSKFETEHGRLLGLSYQPQHYDVVITATPKAGTQWIHGLYRN